MRYAKNVAVASLLLFGAAACGDLEVDNTLAPDADRALANPGDVASLIGGSWATWWNMTYNFNGAAPMLSTMSFQHSAWPANFGMVHYSSIPRVPVTNSTAHDFYGNWANMYTWGYRTIAAANDGLRAIYGGIDLGEDAAMAEAFARFMQGLGYGSLALIFDQGSIVDETTDLTGDLPAVGYQEMMDAAIGYLDQAIAIASANSFEVPSAWTHSEATLTSALLARVASSYKARFRAGVARTPEERAAVDWNAVLADVNAGVTSDFNYEFDGTGNSWNASVYYGLLFGWGQMNYFVHGMADQSGRYQEWLSIPVADRVPDLPSGPFLIDTPDLRFPQGATQMEQIEDGAERSGQVRFRIPHSASGTPLHFQGAVGSQWGRPDRGTWRWSYYRDARTAPMVDVGVSPDIAMAEMNTLAAEAHYRLGNPGAAAELVNITRTAAGLNATDAAGTNTSCVPRLPDGTCGDLFEMMKWEKRMEAGHNSGYLSALWYFEGRGWGDLMQGTILNWPVPARDAELAGLPIVEYGGSMEWGAPVGTYGY